MRVIARPALAASSCQRRGRPSSSVSSGVVFFSGGRAIPGTTAAHEPARLAHLDDGNEGAGLIEGEKGSAHVIVLRHEKLQAGSTSHGASPSPTSIASHACPGRGSAAAARQGGPQLVAPGQVRPWSGRCGRVLLVCDVLKPVHVNTIDVLVDG